MTTPDFTYCTHVTYGGHLQALFSPEYHIEGRVLQTYKCISLAAPPWGVFLGDAQQIRTSHTTAYK